MTYVSAAITNKVYSWKDSDPDAKGSEITGLNDSHFSLIDPYSAICSSIYSNALIISELQFAFCVFFL